MNTAIATRIAADAPPVRAIDAAKPFFSLKQLQDMDRGDLENLALSLQCKTLERTTREGTMVCVQRVVPLVWGVAEDIYEVPQVGVMVNAKGYRKIAAYAGVKYFTPDSISIDGEIRSNPYVERDPVTRSNKRCFVRKVAVWRGPLGEPIARDLTLIYDPGALFLVSLRGKMGKNPNAIKTASRRLNDPCEPGWAFFPEIDMPGVPDLYVGLYVDLSCPDVGACIRDRLDKSKFIERYADTFCERNLTKKMLNINVPRVVNGAAAVSVLAWVAPSDEAFVTRALQAMRGVEDPDDVVKTLEAQGTIVMTEVEDTAGDETVANDHSADADDGPEGRTYQLDAPRQETQRFEQRTPAPEPQPEPAPAATQPGLPMGTPADRSAQIASLMKRLDAAKAKIGAGAYKANCAALDVDPEKPSAGGQRMLEALVVECEEMAQG